MRRESEEREGGGEIAREGGGCRMRERGRREG